MCLMGRRQGQARAETNGKAQRRWPEELSDDPLLAKGTQGFLLTPPKGRGLLPAHSSPVHLIPHVKCIYATGLHHRCCKCHLKSSLQINVISPILLQTSHPHRGAPSCGDATRQPELTPALCPRADREE